MARPRYPHSGQVMTHPATSDPRYSDAEVEFLKAIDKFKQNYRKPFPTWSDALDVLLSLGYRKVALPCKPPEDNEHPTLEQAGTCSCPSPALAVEVNTSEA